MIDWLYRRRDPAAAGTTLVLLALTWAVWRAFPHGVAPPSPVQEMAVTMEDLPPEPPAPPPPPPPPVPPPPAPTPPVPTPAVPRPVAAPTPAPAEPSPAPTAAPAPATPSVAAPAPPPVAAPPAPPVAAPAPPPPPPRNAGVDEIYRAELRTYLNTIKRYPNSREARQLRPQGIVKVWVEVDRNGQLLGTGIDTGSGSLILDNEALRTIRNGRYQAFPADGFAGQTFIRVVMALEYNFDSKN